MTKNNKILILILLEIGFLGYTAMQEYSKIDVDEMKTTLKEIKIRLAREQSEREQKEALRYSKELFSPIDGRIDCLPPSEIELSKLHPTIFSNFKRTSTSYIGLNKLLLKKKATIQNERNPYFTQY